MLNVLVPRWWRRRSTRASEYLLCDMVRLEERLDTLKARYAHAKPFPHVVIDDFISCDVLQLLVRDLPGAGQPMLRKPRTSRLADGRIAQLNKRSYTDREVGPAVRQMIWELNSGIFISWLEALTGIPGLLPDPMLNGAGVHITDPGGLLRIHADYNKHPRYGLDRRINLLLYLNEGWCDEYGGHLELWNDRMTECVVKVAPIASRCVIFNTTSDSFHGHPHPLRCPKGMSRKSIALYYYTNGRPEQERRDRHATLWQYLPSERGAAT